MVVHAAGVRNPRFHGPRALPTFRAMLRLPLRSILVCAVAVLGACATSPRFSDVLDELARHDVVFLGEQHDNAVGHAVELAVLEGLHERRPDVVLAMEMFERDVQPVLDGWLAGEVDDDKFLAESRPWPNYATDYRPLLEFAKENKLRVIAANAPRDLARKASSKGANEVLGSPDVAASTSTPDGPYRTKFMAQIGSHPGVTPAMVNGFFVAQCLKDDTMAESIVRAFDGDNRPLVVHVAGDFHVAEHLGTVERVRWRRPDLKLAVIAMPSPEPKLKKVGAHEWHLSVPIQPPAPPKQKPVAKPAEKPAEHAAEKPAEKPTEKATEPEPEPPTGRPALGFMPDYESSETGVRVTTLRPGGPAEKAGIQEGDVITKIGDEEIGDVSGYMEILSNLTIGKPVKVTLKRGEETKVVEVVVGERQEP